ncbi:LuxR C-terminal-related transcriptional regulator [Nocardioides coralli]|uniref:LuxR C-terminal-related transcriptional regulator n=1 Tax=Nocardioides coralli TaxID=2872154 RepID=UPI001CA3F0E1|nr:LuxR C-terminal-related transcriptional regulator [Nocardioides coralli]QZY30210.1 LuxR C-terminal-related transcriptional regulator [Nocardioides coralli]
MLTPCLGREALQAQLGAALTEARWVTIMGPPGCGKTLLARHAVAPFARTTWVAARGLESLDAVLDACLVALGTERTPGDSRSGTVRRALDGTDSVLVLDGLDVDLSELGGTCQHLVESTTDTRLVLTAPTMAGQPAERVVRVGAMPLPGPRDPLGGPTVELLLSRVAQAGGHPVDLARDEQPVRRLLQATGGLPLLIEQVAVQVALVGLTNVTPTPTLAGTVRASYALLSDAQQRCFRRVAHLTSPAGIDVVAEVAEVPREAAAGLAEALVRRSLLELLPDGRFDMLTPIRTAGRKLEGPDDETEHVRRGLMRWADRVVPHDFNLGAADAPWLRDLPVMRATVRAACEDDDSRDFGYQLANRIFSSLYTSMRARDAVEILETVLASGDGPPEIGAQVARRAGIAASEVRGTYEGLWLLDRADEFAADAPDPAAQLARTAAIRAEMHLDAGDLLEAEREATRAIAHEGPDGYIVRQATRTIADCYVSRGMFREAAQAAASILAGSEANDERWISLSARTQLARIAVEQGRRAEATATCHAVVSEGREIAEDRVALLAETMLRCLDPGYGAWSVDRDSLPWAVRLPVLAQDARDLFVAGDLARAAGLAADVVALADSVRLGRDAVEARLLLGHCLMRRADTDQAATCFLAALEGAWAMPMPLRTADALDALAQVAHAREWSRESGQLAAVATALRAPRRAVRWGNAALDPVPEAAAPAGWVSRGELTAEGRASVTRMFTDPDPTDPSPLDALTGAERQVADRVADGLTSRQIAEELFVSPRTVDAHLTHIYRKLDINTRARLAAMVVAERH